MDMLIIWDKLGTLLATLAGVIIVGIWRKAVNIDKKFAILELELAKNYVTKGELKIVEDKLDHLQDTMTNKIDRVNDNLIMLLRTLPSKGEEYNGKKTT